MLSFTIIVPVYNRPQEVEELLESLMQQKLVAGLDIEVRIVEDGSQITSETIVKEYSRKSPFPVIYLITPNGGPSKARNVGAKEATGEYLIILDSDCILPPGYFKAICKELFARETDAFGGPDRASSNFTDIQKAINYSMTSFFTTGGIRGGKKELDKFYPRSFNMGVKKDIFEKLGGFSDNMRFGEDIDFSIRLYKEGYKVALFPDAWVYHKRRTDWKKFFRQVFNSGIARINLYKKYPDSLKLVHLLPAFFTLFILFSLVGLFFSPWSLLPLVFYTVLIFMDSTWKSRSFKIGILSVVASFIQLTGYGCGFLSAVWNRLILRKGEFAAFEKTFYK